MCWECMRRIHVLSKLVKFDPFSNLPYACQELGCVGGDGCNIQCMPPWYFLG